MSEESLDDVAALTRQITADHALTAEEKLERLEQLRTRLIARIDELEDSPDENSAASYPQPVSSEVAQLVGELVIAAAWAEDAAGMLLQGSTGQWDRKADGYGATSSRLLTALKPVVSNELHERMSTVMEIRHFVVHGIILDGRFVVDPHTGEPAEHMAIKRGFRSHAPERDGITFTAAQLRAVRDEFWKIEDELEELHSQALNES